MMINYVSSSKAQAIVVFVWPIELVGWLLKRIWITVLAINKSIENDWI